MVRALIFTFRLSGIGPAHRPTLLVARIAAPAGAAAKRWLCVGIVLLHVNVQPEAALTVALLSVDHAIEAAEARLAIS